MTKTIGPTERAAPGPLLLVQEFLNTPSVEPTEDELRVADEIRRAGEFGDAQLAIAGRFGMSQQLVSAILRGKRNSGAVTFGTAESTTIWLVSRGLLSPGESLSTNDHPRVLALQHALLALARTNGGEVIRAGTVALLDWLGDVAPLKATFRSGPALVATGTGVNGAVGTILSVVYDSMRDGSWSRLKACPAERCQWVFYDTSRNRTSTWCSMAICGNRTKVRNYQERRRAARAG